MAITRDGIRLLSALRKAKSKSLLYETPENFFEDGEEREAYGWLRNYVETYDAWPTAETFKRQTGVQLVITKEVPAYYQDQCRQKVLWTGMLEPFKEIRRALDAKNPDTALQIMRNVIAGATAINHRREGLITLADSMSMVVEDFETAKRTVGLRGIPTGWQYLDDQTDGWQPADLVTLVGRTGRGKTAALLKMAHAAWSRGYSVLFLSMEMSTLQLARRFFGIETHLNPRLVRAGRLSTYVEVQMRHQIAQMQDEDIPFYWIAGNFKKTTEALRAAVHEVQPDIIFADASYLLKPESKSRFNGRRELIADVIEDISKLAKECNRPVIQSVQFNRQAVRPKRGDDDENDRSPVAHLTLEKIGETDTIGQNSAIVLGIELGDPPHETDRRYMAIMKGREGEHGWFEYNYQWQPVNFDYITDSTLVRLGDGRPNGGPAPNIAGFMEEEI
jgi:replicative DNA helicase